MRWSINFKVLPMPPRSNTPLRKSGGSRLCRTAWATPFEQLFTVVQHVVSILCQVVLSHQRCFNGIIEASLYLPQFTSTVQGTHSPSTVLSPHSSFIEFGGARMQAASEIIVSITGLVGLLGSLAHTAFLDHRRQCLIPSEFGLLDKKQ